MSGEKQVTVRVHKIRKNHIKAKLIFFIVLAAALLLIAILPNIFARMIPMSRACWMRRRPRALHIPLARTVMEGICCRAS